MAAVQESSFPHDHTFESENRKVRVQLFQITCGDLSKCNSWRLDNRSDDGWFKQCRRSRAQHPDKRIPCSKISAVALLLQLIGLTCCLLFWGCFLTGQVGRVSPMAGWIIVQVDANYDEKCLPPTSSSEDVRLWSSYEFHRQAPC